MTDIPRLQAELRDALDRLSKLEAVDQIARWELYSSEQTAPSAKGYVETYLRMVRVRQKVAEEIGECGWMMLLDLYLHHPTPVLVSSACISSAHPPTTALRHLSIILQNGLIARDPDPDDGRRILLSITDEGRAVVDAWSRSTNIQCNRPRRFVGGCKANSDLNLSSP